MEVEHVARVRLAARRAAQQQGHLAIRPGVLREVVVHAQRVLDELPVDLDADLHDLLAEGGARVWREVLERGGVLGTGDDDDRVLHRAVLLERGHGLGDGRQLLADGHVDADQALALLVDDRVDRDRGLPGLAVADDQLALAAPDRDERIDGLDARLDRGVDPLADDDARGDALDRSGLRGLDRALVVERLAQRVHDAAEQRLSDRHLDDAPGRLDRVALLDPRGIAEDDRTDGLLLEVEGHAHDPARELEQLLAEGALQAIDLGDAVADLDDRAHVTRLGIGVERVDRRLDDADDLVALDGHRVSYGRARALAGARHEAIAQALEAAADAGVVEGVADTDGQAADQRVVDLDPKVTGSTRHLAA